MRLKSVWISEYKNLKDIKLNFGGQSFIDIFVGKNGSGKSNFFEALLEIFRHLYEFDPRAENECFDYSMSYEIEGLTVEIAWKKRQLTINGHPEKNTRKAPLPDNVLIYYSGHNSKVSELVHSYETDFKNAIKKADIQDTRKFIGIGKEYKQLLLTVLLLQKDDNKAKRFICEKLGIVSIADDIKITLMRPYYARGKKGFDIVINDETDRYWKPEGITKDFLNKLIVCRADGAKAPLRAEGYFSDTDHYILYLDIEAIQREFAGYSLQEIFRQFDNLKTLEMLTDISIPITLLDGTQATTDHFSDGQYQSVYIYSIIEIFKDHNCLTLLDEPDSFLHPEWQFEFLKQVFEVAESDVSKNHVLLSSHSASTICSLPDSHLNLFDIREKRVDIYKMSKNEIISSLSKGFIKLSEDESVLRIENAIRSNSKPVLFVEGPSDVLILESAYRKLYETDQIPILFQDAFNRGFVRVLMSRNDIYEKYPQKVFFALFDFDDAYEDWRELKGQHCVTDLCCGLCKKLHEKNGYALLLPISDNELKAQVWDDSNPIEKIKPNPYFSIEHLFWGLTETNGYFNEKTVNGEKIIVFKGDNVKVKFAENIVSKLPKENFEIFRPMFEFIKANCSSASSGQGNSLSAESATSG